MLASRQLPPGRPAPIRPGDHVHYRSDGRIAVERGCPAPHHLDRLHGRQGEEVPVDPPGLETVQWPPVQQQHHVLRFAPAVEAAHGDLRVEAEPVEVENGEAGRLLERIRNGPQRQIAQLLPLQDGYGGGRSDERSGRALSGHHNGIQVVDPGRVRSGRVSGDRLLGSRKAGKQGTEDHRHHHQNGPHPLTPRYAPRSARPVHCSHRAIGVGARGNPIPKMRIQGSASSSRVPPPGTGSPASGRPVAT